MKTKFRILNLQSMNLEISVDFPPLLTFHTRRVVRACMKAVYHRVLTGANPREEPCELGVAHAYTHAYVFSSIPIFYFPLFRLVHLPFMSCFTKWQLQWVSVIATLGTRQQFHNRVLPKRPTESVHCKINEPSLAGVYVRKSVSMKL